MCKCEHVNIENRLRTAQGLMDDVASRIPPFSPEQVHTLLDGDRLPQYQLRRQADRYLLIFCLLVLALAASVLWHTAPFGYWPLAVGSQQPIAKFSILNSQFSILNSLVILLAVIDCWVAWRAARSLWLMWQMRRHRRHPYRMSRYADRLSRLSRRRRWWLGLVLPHSANSQFSIFNSQFPRLPSYSIAACIFLLIVLNADKAFATTRDYVKVTTTSGKSDSAICDTVNKTIEHL